MEEMYVVLQGKVSVLSSGKWEEQAINREIQTTCAGSDFQVNLRIQNIWIYQARCPKPMSQCPIFPQPRF